MDAYQDRQIESPASNHHQSSVFKPPRRSTFLARPLDQSEPVYENPNNTPERNLELLSQYENLQALNRTLGAISDNLETTKLELNRFNYTINRTNGLLDLWLQILENTEKTKSLIENPEWHGAPSKEKIEKQAGNDHIKKRRLNG
ncbi:DASH complex subunit Duo1-domain-containing protein [Pilaira anomala]|nr:DASH complex subunit Duo1-domain-containing protein [Pilaira anomala]